MLPKANQFPSPAPKHPITPPRHPIPSQPTRSQTTISLCHLRWAEQWKKVLWTFCGGGKNMCGGGGICVKVCNGAPIRFVTRPRAPPWGGGGGGPEPGGSGGGTGGLRGTPLLLLLLLFSRPKMVVGGRIAWSHITERSRFWDFLKSVWICIEASSESFIRILLKSSNNPVSKNLQ